MHSLRKQDSTRKKEPEQGRGLTADLCALPIWQPGMATHAVPGWSTHCVCDCCTVNVAEGDGIGGGDHLHVSTYSATLGGEGREGRDWRESCAISRAAVTVTVTELGQQVLLGARVCLDIT